MSGASGLPSARLRADETRGPDERVREGQLRRIALVGETVDYRLLRSRRGTIGMEIDLSGLTVRAPNWVTIREIELALTERAAWIVETLVAWRARRRETLPRVWTTGAPILYRGRDLALAVFPSRRCSVRVDMFDFAVLHPAASDPHEIATFVGHWLREQAGRLMNPRVVEFATRLTGAAPPVKLSNARSEWGSCNHRGEIRLNWRLVQLPPDLADYVVAHEVAHLVELNHSPRFWALVEKLLPGHARLRDELEEWTALLVA